MVPQGSPPTPGSASLAAGSMGRAEGIKAYGGLGTAADDGRWEQASPGGSDTDGDDDDEQPTTSPAGRLGKNVKAGSKKLATDKSNNGQQQQPQETPAQKRRRVTRACDECRRKKIRCNGAQPCIHCQVYSYACTFDKPSNRRRNPALQYVEALEERLHKAETLLRDFVPDLDLSDPTLDPAVQQEFRNRERARALASGVTKEALDALPRHDTRIPSMIESFGQLDLDEKGSWDFHGVSSGAVFLELFQKHLPNGTMQFWTKNRSILPKADGHPGILSLDTRSPTDESPADSDGRASSYILPPRETADRLCELSLYCATCLAHIVHIPSFFKSMDRLYQVPVDQYNVRDTRFLALLYAVMALGCLYDLPRQATEEEAVHKVKLAHERGLEYYRTARYIMHDITECQDLTTLQAILFIIFFLQGSARLSSCYGFVGIAFRSAISMGLHRHISHPMMSKIEDQVRRRVFYVIRQVDIYLSAILGFPMMNMDDAIDQPFPTEVDDEFITDSEILTPPPDTPSYMEAFNAHTRLMYILAKAIKAVYPLKKTRHGESEVNGQPAALEISYRRIMELANELRVWLEQLPDFWKPNTHGDEYVVRIRHLLRFAYAHVQMMLYRPFIHFCSPKLRKTVPLDHGAWQCASSAVNISRNMIHIGIEILKHEVSPGPYWFRLYTELTAVLVLVFYAIENPDKEGSKEIMADAIAGKEMISKLKYNSLAGEQVSNMLETFFERLPNNPVNPSGTIPFSSRKRPASPSKDVEMEMKPVLHKTHAMGEQDPAPSPTLTRRSSTNFNFPRERPNIRPVLVDMPSFPVAELNTSGIKSVVSAGPASAPVVCQYTSTSFPMSSGLPVSAAAPAPAPPHAFPNQPFGLMYNDMFSCSDPFAYPYQHPQLDLTQQSGFAASDHTGLNAAASTTSISATSISITESAGPYGVPNNNNTHMGDRSNGNNNNNMFDGHGATQLVSSSFTGFNCGTNDSALAPSFSARAVVPQPPSLISLGTSHSGRGRVGSDVITTPNQQQPQQQIFKREPSSACASITTFNHSQRVKGQLPPLHTPPPPPPPPPPPLPSPPRLTSLPSSHQIQQLQLHQQEREQQHDQPSTPFPLYTSQDHEELQDIFGILNDTDMDSNFDMFLSFPPSGLGN